MPFQGVVTRTELEGVRHLRADDDSAFLVAGLTFRTGWADEPVRLRGMTHLVEHLAHADIPTRNIEFNGWVGPTETSFWVRGRPHEVADHLRAIVRGLTRPDPDEVERERGVLRAEAGGQGLAVVDRRFANHGFGNCAWPEYALEGDDPEAPGRWAAERFTRSAAVVWSTGELEPIGLDALPAGAPPGWPWVVRAPGWRPRGHLVWSLGSVAWSGEGTTGWAGSGALELLHQRATNRLRHELGVSYSVDTGSFALGPGRRVRWVEAPVSGDTSPVLVRDALLEGLDGLARRVDDAEFEALRDRRLRVADEDDSAPWLLGLAATSLLEGEDPDDMTDVVAAWRTMEPADVRAAAAELRDSMLLAVPLAARPTADALPSIEPVGDEPLAGEPYRCARRRAGEIRDPTTETTDLRLDPAVGVSATRGDDTIRIAFQDATVAVVKDDVEIYLFDAADRAVVACAHDDEDRRAWLTPVVEALGPERVVRLRSGRPAALRRIEELVDEGLKGRKELRELAYSASQELRRFEEVEEVLAARHDGDVGLVVLTPERVVFRGRDDSWWFEAVSVRSATGTESFRGGTLSASIDGTPLTLDRVRPKGAATRLADALLARRPPA